MPTVDYDPPPINWLLCAKDYLELATLGFSDLKKQHFSRNLPIYLLCGHAFELTLKAFLACAGWTKQDLKNRFSHNLLELHAECVRNGLRPIEDDATAHDLDVLNSLHIGPFLSRYPQAGLIPPHDPEGLLRICGEIQEEVELTCQQHLSRYAEARRAARS